MTQIAAFAGNDQRINFFNYFIGSKNNSAQKNHQVFDEPKSGPEQLLLKWLENSKVLKPVKSTTIAANRIFLTDRVIIKFELSNDYREHFVLLRGLLEFSRPKGIAISAHNSEKNFELHIGNDQAAAVISYLHIILQSFIKEINFKKALKSVLVFEQTVKQQQAKLYNTLKVSIQ